MFLYNSIQNTWIEYPHMNHSFIVKIYWTFSSAVPDVCSRTAHWFQNNTIVTTRTTIILTLKMCAEIMNLKFIDAAHNISRCCTEELLVAFEFRYRQLILFILNWNDGRMIFHSARLMRMPAFSLRTYIQTRAKLTVSIVRYCGCLRFE